MSLRAATEQCTTPPIRDPRTRAVAGHHAGACDGLAGAEESGEALATVFALVAFHREASVF